MRGAARVMGWQFDKSTFVGVSIARHGVDLNTDQVAIDRPSTACFFKNLNTQAF
jgi:hypothetical protein